MLPYCADNHVLFQPVINAFHDSVSFNGSFRVTSDERLIETVRWTMPVFLGGMTIFGLQRACQNMFVALGQARISIFIALLRKAILLIPLALILPHFMGVTGVYAAEAISDATAAICCTLLFFWQFPKILGKIQGNTLRTS